MRARLLDETDPEPAKPVGKCFPDRGKCWRLNVAGIVGMGMAELAKAKVYSRGEDLEIVGFFTAVIGGRSLHPMSNTLRGWRKLPDLEAVEAMAQVVRLN